MPDFQYTPTVKATTPGSRVRFETDTTSQVPAQVFFGSGIGGVPDQNVPASAVRSGGADGTIPVLYGNAATVVTRMFTNGIPGAVLETITGVDLLPEGASPPITPGGGGAAIDDTTASSSTVFSSAKQNTTYALLGKPTAVKTSAYTAAAGDVVLAGGNVRTVLDANTTTSSTTLTSATAAFTAADVGRAVKMINVPVNTIIASVTNSTTVVLSAAATATQAAFPCTFAGGTVITLPTSATAGTVVRVKKTDASSQPISVVPASGDSIDSFPSVTIAAQYVSRVFTKGSSTTWTISEGLTPTPTARGQLSPGQVNIGWNLNNTQLLGSDGTNTYGMYQYRHLLHADAYDLRLVYGNQTNQGNADGTNTSGAGYNPITIRAGVGYSSASTTYPVTFSGKRDVTVDAAGGFVVSDPISIDVTSNTYLWERVMVSVASAGMKWPVGRQIANSPGNEGYELGTTVNDKTISGTVSSANGVAGYGCIAILATLKSTGRTSIVWVGDSWSNGTLLDNVHHVPIVQLSRTGEAVKDLTLAARRFRWELLTSGTHIMSAYGINDFQNPNPFVLATVENLYIQHWIDLSKRAPVIAWTCSPKTVTADGWATSGGQSTTGAMTDAAAEAGRISHNTWLRDGAPLNPTTLAYLATGSTGAVRAGQPGHPLALIIDMASMVESGLNSGLWKSSGRQVIDAAITSGATTLTSATANFTAADVGKGVFVAGAVTNVGATITAVTNSTTATVSIAATGTVTGAVAGIQAYGWTQDGVHPTSLGATSWGSLVTAMLGTL